MIPRHLKHPKLALWLLIPIVMLTSGCKEDLGHSRAASAEAGVTAQNRLNSALFSIQETLGKQEPRQKVERPTLRWEAPTTREDGSRLYSSDIQEYRIYYRLKHQENFRAVARPATEGTAFTLDGFEPGAYVFSVSAVDRTGRESRRSDGVSVNLI